eukprot:TRINITY_DN16144_c0_g1_i1.p1 TRINITY_DN16144_c0_g1~~TRINITY_DN16144_c0_g1_i1.p1  ORF type:complete len:515 (+),score=152.42 TRINITY_DN16144_c0_g1_i1:53-1546(+)
MHLRRVLVKRVKMSHLRWMNTQPFEIEPLQNLEGKSIIEVSRATDLLVKDPWDEDFTDGDEGNDRRVSEIEKEFTSWAAEGKKEDQLVAMALHLSGVYIKNYSLDKAEKMLNRILPWCRAAQGPYLWKILQKIATLRFKQNRQPECAELLEELASIAPPNAATHANLTTAYNSIGDYEKALDHINKGIALKGETDKDDKWALGLVKKNLGDTQAGIQYLKEALEGHYNEAPDDKVMIAKLHDSLADAYLKNEDLEQAERHYQTAYEYFKATVGDSSPLTGSAAGLVGKVQMLQGKKIESLKYLTAALKVEANKDGIHCTPLYELVSSILSIYVEESVPAESGALSNIHPFLEQAIVNLDSRNELTDGNGGVLLHKIGEAYLLSQPSEHHKAYSTLKRAQCLLVAETQADLTSLLDILAVEISAVASNLTEEELCVLDAAVPQASKASTTEGAQNEEHEPINEVDLLKAENDALKAENARLRSILSRVKDGFAALEEL